MLAGQKLIANRVDRAVKRAKKRKPQKAGVKRGMLIAQLIRLCDSDDSLRNAIASLRFALADRQKNREPLDFD